MKLIMEVRVDIDPEKEEEFNDWYNNVHLPGIVNCPGFTSGRRYRSIRGEPKFMALYEIESVDALKSEQFIEESGWYQFETGIKNFSWNLYTQLHEYVKEE
jgi:hypothetical protein